MNWIGFVIGIPIGIIVTLSLYFGKDWIPFMRSKEKPEIVYVSSKLNRPGLRIPVKNANSTIVWIDNNESGGSSEEANGKEMD